MSTFYIATSLSRIEDHNKVRDQLYTLGHELSYDWTTHGSVKHVSSEKLCAVAQKEVQGVRDAETILILLPGGIGTHTELGMSLALQKNIFLHSEDPAFFEVGEKTCAFYHHPLVEQVFCPLENFTEEIMKRGSLCSPII